MLNHIEIENFRCLRHVSVPLRPLTVLIGANDSGKSSFLASVECLLRNRTEYQPGDHWRGDPFNEILMRGKTPRAEIVTRSLDQSGTILEQPGETQERATLIPVQRFQLPSSGVSMGCQGYEGEEETFLPIDADGARVPALLDYLVRRDRRRFDGIVNALREQIPGFEDLGIATPNRERRQILFSIEHGLRIPADAASTGVRLLLFFIAIAHHPRPPRTILIEEPETGLHPKRLASVMKLMRELTTGSYGDHAAQIILTTHSPYLLDFVELDKDQVLVFHRNEDGSRSAEPVDVDRMRNFLDEFKLGEVWFNEEEAGLVAKK